MRTILYGEPGNGLDSLFDAMKTLGQRVAWRNPRFFGADQMEACDLVATAHNGHKVDGIKHYYGRRGTPVAVHEPGKWHLGESATCTDAEMADGTPIVEWLGLRWSGKPVPTGEAKHWTPLESTVRDGMWAGRRCFILGGGPSLAGVNLGFLRGELVIATNRAYELIDPAILYSMDYRFLAWVRNGAFGTESTERFNALLATKVWLQTQADGDYAGVFGIKNNQNDRLTWHINEGFCKGDNSGFGAINLALCLGATEIYLLGFDLVTRGQDQKWWHSGYPKRESDQCYQRMRRYFDKYAPQIAARGVKVVNLNPASGLQCFEFGRVADLAPTPKRPLVIGYYTTGTGYEAEAKRMIASAHRMGFECDVRPVDNLGGWQKNTYYKASFMRSMLDEHPERDLLWLDADVVVCQYPALFDNFEADFGVNIVDWARYGKPDKGRELNTSVVYLRNNNRVRRLLEAWIAANEKRIDTGVWEQKVLQDVLASKAKNLKLKVLELPDAYCQIFDLMAAQGAPVIELHQASRKLKQEVGA